MIDLIIDSSRPSIVLSSSDSDIQMHLKASQVMKLYSKCLILFYFGNADGFAHRLQKELQAYEKLVNFKVILLLNETKSTTQGRFAGLMDETVVIYTGRISQTEKVLK